MIPSCLRRAFSDKKAKILISEILVVYHFIFKATTIVLLYIDMELFDIQCAA